MQRRELIGESKTPDGVPITLAKEGGGAFVIRIGGASLMSSRVHGSEEAMAEVAKLRPDARVLVGGLGMGYTLRAALDAIGPRGEVVVAELLPILVEWNRGPLGPLAAHPLDDPRTKLAIADVAEVIRTSGTFDAILLDVDNAPDAFTVESNAWLYRPAGLAAIKRALRPGGALVVWSAAPSPGFMRAMRSAGLRAEEIVVRARGNVVHKGSRHLLYVGRLVFDSERRSATEVEMAKGQEKGAKGNNNKPKLTAKEKKARKKAKAAK